MSVKVDSVKVSSGRHSTATITITDAYSSARGTFDDLPADMRLALREWVGCDEIWRDGWSAHAGELAKQRENPNYPIGEDVSDWRHLP